MSPLLSSILRTIAVAAAGILLLAMVLILPFADGILRWWRRTRNK